MQVAVKLYRRTYFLECLLDITISDILERNATPEQRERQVDIADVLLEEMLKERQLK